MTQYYCKECGYRFTPKGARLMTLCPYCGKTGALVMGMETV